MLAFVGTVVSKQDMLAELVAHAEADELVKGQYWEDGKGCAIGCVLESIRKIRGYKTIDHTSHGTAEDETNIPEMVWHLVDSIFEGLPNRSAKEWPMRFTRSIAHGADLSLVGWQFLHWLLTDKRVNPGIDHDLVRDAVRRCADVLAPLAKGGPAKAGAGKSAASAASAVSAASAASAASVARAAEGAASAASAAWAAESAAWAASSAAREAASAAASAAWAAEGAESAEGAANVARAAEGAASAASAASAALAAEGAESAAWAASSAAREAESAAARAAWAAEGAESAAWAASSAASVASWVLMADKLVELIEAAPVPEGAYA